MTVCSKRLLWRAIGPCLIALGGRPSSAAPVWNTVEQVSYPWTGAQNYVFTVEAAAPTASGGGAVEDSPELRITGPRHTSLVVSVSGGLVTKSQGVSRQSLLKDDLLSSQYLYLSPRLVGQNHAPALIVFGWAYASDPGSIRVIALDASGRAHVAFASDTFLLEDIVDLDGDGIDELVGRPSLSQKFGGCLETYDPFAVYRFFQHSTTDRALFRKTKQSI